MMDRFKWIVSAILGGFFVLFAIQNMAPVQITMLFWTFESRRILVLTMIFLIAFILGWVVKTVSTARSGKLSVNAIDAEPTIQVQRKKAKENGQTVLD